jgi:hypothetical protein
MMSGLESGFESENANRARPGAARAQAVSADVVNRPKKRQGKRLRSSSTTRDAMIG